MKKQFFTKKNLALIISPVLVTCLGLGVFFGVKSNTNNKEDNEVNNQYNEIDYSYSKVFLKDKDNTLVPLTIKYEKFDSLGEELMYVTNMLKVDSKVSNSTFKGLLPSNTKVKSLELKDNVLNLNFDENFMTYDSKDELRLLESLVWTLTDFNEVDSINLYVNDERLTNMPVSNTPIKFNVDRQIGINNYLLTSTILGSGQKVLSYYEKQINDSYYYVPVTHYVNNKENINISAGVDFSVPEIYEKLLPVGINKYDFYSALYELCGVFSLGESVFDTIMVNNEKKLVQDIHFS